MHARSVFESFITLFRLWNIVCLQEDVEEECSKYGAVLHCYVEAKAPGGFVYMMFAQVAAAVQAATALNGRWFAGRGITVEYVQPEMYKSQFPEAASRCE